MIGVSDELKAELDRRLAEFEANPEAGLPWEEVREWIVQRRWRTSAGLDRDAGRPGERISVRRF
ncbi:MAG: addiction module protein [Thermoanaerobaculia bacterium]